MSDNQRSGFFGVNNLSLPIQMVKDYEFCPYNISLGGFIAIKTFGKLLFYFSCIAITALIAVLSRKSLLSAAAAIILCAGPKILANYLCSAAENEIRSGGKGQDGQNHDGPDPAALFRRRRCRRSIGRFRWLVF